MILNLIIHFFRTYILRSFSFSRFLFRFSNWIWTCLIVLKGKFRRSDRSSLSRISHPILIAVNILLIIKWEISGLTFISELKILGPSIISFQPSPPLWDPGDPVPENMKRSNSLNASWGVNLSSLGFAISICCQRRLNGIFLPFAVESPPSSLSHRISDNISGVMSVSFIYKILILLQNSFSWFWRISFISFFPRVPLPPVYPCKEYFLFSLIIIKVTWIWCIVIWSFLFLLELHLSMSSIHCRYWW